MLIFNMLQRNAGKIFILRTQSILPDYRTSESLPIAMCFLFIFIFVLENCQFQRSSNDTNRVSVITQLLKLAVSGWEW